MSRRTMTLGWLAVAGTLGCTAFQSGRITRSEPIVGKPCEGCEAVFQGLPSNPSEASRIAPLGETGQALRIEGKVTREDGTTASGIVVYAYQTNAQGHYPPNQAFQGKAAFRHGLLRGWARTNSEGRYRFDTIRPAGYPNTDLPQHVHMHVLEPGRCTYYIDDLMFADDPRLTPAKRSELTSGRGGSGIASPRRDSAGVWTVRRDIVLGKSIPGYPAR